MATSNWDEEAKKARDVLSNSIPRQWLADPSKLPPADKLNVEDFPRESGLLSEEDLTITDMSATALVSKMGRGELTAESVVTAFLRRATLGHQLVSKMPYKQPIKLGKTESRIAEFCYRIHGGSSN